MKKILKRILSAILAMAMLIVTVPIDVMADSESSSSTVTISSGNQEVEYYISENEESRTVTFSENGEKHIAEYNKSTGEIFFDGVKKGEINSLGIETYTLHEYNRYEGNLGELTGSVSSVAAVILSIAGFPGASKAAELANVILSEGYKKVWYRVIEYYDDEFTGSRPTIIRKFYFYSDANYTQLIWSS